MPSSKKNEKQEKTKYKKQAILKSKLFSEIEKDWLSPLLKDNEYYSIDECENILKKEKGRMVK